MIERAEVLAHLPPSLRSELFETYLQITSNYLERRWEPSELNGGKFSEVVYSILDGALKEDFPGRSFKPPNMLSACQALEKVPANAQRVGDRSLRILIPRLLPVLYEVRNNRGVGHVGGDVDPNHMDSQAVQSMASWIMAELVRIFHGVKTTEAQETVDALVERKSPLIWYVGDIRRVLDPKMSAKNQVLVLLHHNTSWVSITDLLRWVEYSNNSLFRSKVLMPMHKSRLIEVELANARARISPLGIKVVEQDLLTK